MGILGKKMELKFLFDASRRNLYGQEEGVPGPNDGTINLSGGTGRLQARQKLREANITGGKIREKNYGKIGILGILILGKWQIPGRGMQKMCAVYLKKMWFFEGDAGPETHPNPT